jgi:uncharacterized membrane protein
VKTLELLFLIERLSILLLGVGVGLIAAVALWAVSRAVKAWRRVGKQVATVPHVVDRPYSVGVARGGDR